MFSARLPASFTVKRLTRALAGLRADDAAVLDLTETNPTRVGLEYPAALLAPLADPASLAYAPTPRGLSAAREAIAIDYVRHGLDVDPAHIYLTASTSEAYSLLFKLLCDPQDEVLVPRPSYPLFEHLTMLDGVRAVPYALDYHGVWSLDLDGLRDAITPRTRAILIVSPNNPTGSMLKARELDAVAALCAQHGLALIGDEVFADYVFRDAPVRETPSRDVRVAAADTPVAAGAAPSAAAGVSVLTQDRVLTFALGGLSKSAGLPQLKLGWIAMKGPAAIVDDASDRLDLICDTYLSVATPVQRAAAALLEQGAIVRGRIHARLDANRRAIQRALAQAPGCTLLHLEAGWSAVLRVPAIGGEEALVLDLLARDRVLVAPGYFYDFPREAYLVVSLLPDPDVFAAGLDRTLARASALMA
jgi:alanine-synthesizing transaminase